MLACSSALLSHCSRYKHDGTHLTFGAGMPKVEEKEYKIEFLQIYLSKPTITESDGETSILFPKEARLRSLT